MCPSLVVATCLASALSAIPQSSPSLEDVLNRVSQYVAEYGARASMFVGTESYTQRVEDADQLARAFPPRHLVSEFAIVKAGSGENWVGYRDVVEVNDKAVTDRRDRLLRLLTSDSIDVAQLKRINDESARYNIGPISRNFNVPTTALFFLHPATVSRFSFERRGTKEIDGVTTWELDFRETARPTLVSTRDGRDVPIRGRLCVVPNDGTVVSTRLEFQNFADKPPTWTSTRMNDRIESLAVVEVTYRLEKALGVWLPARMSETYEGPMTASASREPYRGRATGLAEYSAFRRFETSGRLVPPK